MMNGVAPIYIATISKYYTKPCQEIAKETTDGLPPSRASGPRHIERPGPNPIVQPPFKGVLRKYSYNLKSHATQNYSIVEDLAQAPSTMSTLEVLQSCLSQLKAFLSTTGGIDPSDSSLIAFDLENFVPCLPH